MLYLYSRKYISSCPAAPREGPKVYISKLHGEADFGTESPGPIYDTNYKDVSKVRFVCADSQQVSLREGSQDLRNKGAKAVCCLCLRYGVQGAASKRSYELF